MNEKSELEKILEKFSRAGQVEVHEDGQWLAELAGLSFELHVKGEEQVLHLWSDLGNLTRRVVKIEEETEDRLTLLVSRFGAEHPGKLEFLLAKSLRPVRRVTREQFRARFGRMLAEQFPDARAKDLTTGEYLQNSFPGTYPRCLLKEENNEWAVMGVSPSEPDRTKEAILSFGLLWLDVLRRQQQKQKEKHPRSKGARISGLRLILPENAIRVTNQRLQAISPDAKVEIYEFSTSTWLLRRIERGDTGNVESRLTQWHDAEASLLSASRYAERIRALAPGAIRMRIPAGSRETEFRFHGLEFARCKENQIQFGLAEPRRAVNDYNWNELKALVRELELRRNALAEDRNHPLYRAAPERWLEELVRAEPARLDAQLDARHLYSQAPAFSGGDRGVMDLLGVTRRGRLVVIELKASEDIHLPLQAVDYWQRVRTHQRDGNFQRYGYFTGIELDQRPPLLWLVAPELRFHPSTNAILQFISREIQITKIGLNENWRRGWRVVSRKSGVSPAVPMFAAANENARFARVSRAGA